MLSTKFLLTYVFLTCFLLCCSKNNLSVFFSLPYSSKSDGSVSILLIDLAVDVIHQVSEWAKL